MMVGSDTPQPSPDESAARVMGVVHRLVLDAIRSSNGKNAVFRILNDSAKLIPYERAALWSFSGAGPRLLGVSGQAVVPPRTELVDAWRRIAADAGRPDGPVHLSPNGRRARDWNLVTGDEPEKQVLWLPVHTDSGVDAALWLERGANAPWRDDEISVLAVLMEGYAVALERHRVEERGWWRRFVPEAPKRRMTAGIVAGVVALIFFLCPFRLRVVAPCEIVAADPHLVTAPLNGVIETLHVEPGVSVKKGTLLFQYEETIPQQELKVAQQQVEVAQAQLDRATVLTLRGEDTEGQVAILRDRLAQERARLDLSQSVVDRLPVRAAVDGVVQITAPHTWEGRPVRIGERVMTIVDPERTKVRIWIPQDDNVPGLIGSSARVVLYAKPHVGCSAQISFVSSAAGLSPAGLSAFLAEAVWAKGRADEALGLKGQAVLYGSRVSLAYWICRKPWAAIRKHLGL